MTIEVYASINDTDYYRLDLIKSETILMKYTYKDTQDLSKIYSPYSQSFALQGSLNNQKIFGFLGETKIIKTKANNIFDCKIYNNGLLAKKGSLKVTEVRYENGKIKSYTANFTTKLLSLKDRIGEDKVSDLGNAEIQWTSIAVKNYIQDGINMGVQINPNFYSPSIFIVPFISNYRVWQIDSNINDATKLDNIAYNINADKNGDNFINVNELAPALQFRTIINLIKEKYDLDIIMPLENEQFYNDLYVYCNKIQGAFNSTAYYDIISPFNYILLPQFELYSITANNFTNEFTITKNYSSLPSVFTITNFDVNLAFLNVMNTRSNENININVVFERLDGSVLEQKSNDVKNGDSSYGLNLAIKDSWFVNNEFKFKVKVSSSFPITWENSYIEMYYNLRYLNNTPVFVLRRSYNDNSASMNMSKIDLLKSLPDLKVVDFLTSFFKTFNISIFETSPDDGRLYWLTPKDIEAQNKEYSKTEVDYTDYVIDDKLNKKIANDYNYYNFKHKTSKYKSNADYLQIYGKEYGQLTYPTIKPTSDLSEFKIETNYAIIKSSPVIGLTENTLYGFTNEAPTVQPNNALRYKPNTDDFTLFFYNGQVAPRTPYLGYLNVYSNGTKVVEQLNAITIVGSIHNQSGFNLGFGLIENATQESLYENYYKDQTERLLEPNTLQHTYTLELPPDELVLNYANTNQGESNIPSGFRLQNDIIIGETRYSVIDATIDQTTGKTTLNLLNYV